jgi:hypothetical protein
MPKRKRRKTMVTRRRKKTSTSRKPIGFTRVKGKYKLVFGTKKKPRLGKSAYKTKKSLTTAAKKYF